MRASAIETRPIEFPGAFGSKLAARLDLPRLPHAFALYAHCFTCGKDIFAAARIAEGLAARGIAILRFDFTGLGGSEGDFAGTNFSSNVQDLLEAANFLRMNFSAPDLLIGHSLGGAAVPAVAPQVPKAVGVVTIGAPASAAHVMHNFAAHLAEIETKAPQRSLSLVDGSSSPNSFSTTWPSRISFKSWTGLGRRFWSVMRRATSTSASTMPARSSRLRDTRKLFSRSRRPIISCASAKMPSTLRTSSRRGRRGIWRAPAEQTLNTELGSHSTILHSSVSR